jgi:hypothetical protein
MSQYVIAVTAQHDAVDYNYFKRLARDNMFECYVTRGDESNRRNMTFIPKSYTTSLNHHDVIDALNSNSPLLITYEIQAHVEGL